MRRSPVSFRGWWLIGIGCAILLLSTPRVQAQIRAYLDSPAGAAESETGRAVLEQMDRYLAELRDAPPARYCGTSLGQYYQEHRGDLSPSALAVVHQALPALVRPVLDEYYDVPGAPFRVHFTRSGLDSVRNATSDTAADGVPVYVHVAADALTHAYDLLIDSLGYNAAHFGYTIPWGDGSAGGGTDLYDCYLARPDGRVFVIALTQTDVEVARPNGTIIASSYQVVHPTMEPFPQVSDPLDLLRITCAHEFFHAVHFSLDAKEKPAWQSNGWWLEGTSTWFEDYAFPDVNDWTNLPAYLEAPQRSITSSEIASDLHPYGGGSLWSFYLVERFGSVDILRDIWTGCALMAGDNTLAAMDGILQAAQGISLDSAWSEFANWCMRTGSRWDDSSFSQAASWPEAWVAADTVSFLSTLARYPSGVHFTDGVDGLDGLLGPQSAITTIDGGPLSLHSLAFFPVTLIGRQTESGTSRIFVESVDSLPVVFNYVGRNEYSFPPAVEWGALSRGDTTQVVNWTSYDSLFAVAAAGVHYANAPGDGGLGENTPFILAAIDTSLSDVAIQPVFPNPARFDQGDTVHFKLDLPTRINLRIDLFTLAGDRVRSLVLRNAVGPVELVWDGRNDGGVLVASGLYLCRIRVGDVTEVLRVGVVR